MSAWILHTDSIDLIVTAALEGAPHDRGLRVVIPNANGEGYEHRTYTDQDADELGQLLVDANYASVNYRYDEAGLPPVYKFRRVSHIGGDSGAVIPWGHILRTLSCYEYQSCEMPDWKESHARRICDRIRDKVCDRLAGPDAPWGWVRDIAREREQAIRDRLAAGNR